MSRDLRLLDLKAPQYEGSPFHFILLRNSVSGNHKPVFLARVNDDPTLTFFDGFAFDFDLEVAVSKPGNDFTRYASHYVGQGTVQVVVFLHGVDLH